MRHRSLLPAIGLLVALGLIVPGAARAQGNGRPKGPKTPAPTTTTTSTTPVSETTAPVTVTTVRQFGAWLDDASASARGQGYTSIGIGYWRLSTMSQTNFPMLGAGVGLSDRMQVSASVPFYRVDYQGTTSTGMDDVYIGAKYTLIDPTLTLSEFGLAVSPVMEVLSAGSPDGRVHFAVPVNVEVRRRPFRVYGSGGYFTRGSVFSGGALEWSTSSVVLTGSVTQSYSLKEDAVLDSLGIGRRRADVSLGMAFPLANTAAAFMNVGRSLTSVDEGGTKLALSGGISVRFSATSTP